MTPAQNHHHHIKNLLKSELKTEIKDINYVDRLKPVLDKLDKEFEAEE